MVPFLPRSVSTVFRGAVLSLAVVALAACGSMGGLYGAIPGDNRPHAKVDRARAMPIQGIDVARYQENVDFARYKLVHEPFIPFDVIDGVGQKASRMPHDDARRLIAQSGLTAASVIHDGGPLAVSAAMELMGRNGRHGAQEAPEGVVYRVETDGRFNFMAKWVDPH